MLRAMSEVFHSFSRALLYCLHPRVIWLSLLPIVLATGFAFGLAWLYWEPATEGVRQALERWSLLQPVLTWLDQFTGGVFRSVIGPLVVVVLAVPLLLIVSLLLVSAFMGSALVRLVARRRFPDLEAKRGAAWWRSLAWSLASTVLAVAVLVVSLPFWLIPPLALVLPPLVWGWLSYRVMSYDALSEHASVEERRAVMARHRWPLYLIGVITGYLGAAPSLVWIGGATMALVMMPVLIPLFVWLYTLVFAFASLWFTHFCLGALARLRQERQVEVVPIEPVPAADPAAQIFSNPGRLEPPAP
jgi:hypothetical protein